MRVCKARGKMKWNDHHTNTNRRFLGKTTSQRGKSIAKATVFFISSLFVLAGLFDFLGCLDFTTFAGFTRRNTSKTTNTIREFPHKCDVVANQTRDIPMPEKTNRSRRSSATCPSYFRWIHEDLRPWKETGITRDMIERAKKTAHVRVVILDGKVYVKKYRKAIQTRDVFTLWGILQLIRWYPGRLPDLELMFDCNDRPTVRSNDFKGQPAGPPPLFRYCSDDASLDIVFPDWSFWGWAEVNIKPWGKSLEALKEGNKMTQWKDRTPYAYWRGNPHVDPTRRDLLRCNVSDREDWNTRLYIQDWDKETKEGFKSSNLENQCTHRYKIYIEGWAWSVSEKYIMACDSMTLYVRPRFYDFYIRGMMPLQHYWPIRDNSKCTSLKFAVHWGNNHIDKARGIAEAGSRFIREDVKMELVYDYMFHLLNEYGKLLKFRPEIPRGATEITPENMGCPATGRWKDFMAESMVMSPSERYPCGLPPPYDPLVLKEVLDTKINITRQVEAWEDEYWRDINKKN
ncbi:PREDICTED: O-glucosyltransferase rumi homolog isoform X2 [Tarenaya hassleriana]|nr:PREDICTED: O-glucosyltransferase rumi homolog isoform X2 [Tarenaya hassleriana]XP_010523737.1 PREDICTED: O-glucosyltransferase rumi homolog isoform X2 [Tarenaya hassleriana]